VTLIVMMWGMTAPSYWRDESATLAATERSIPQLLSLLHRVDAVHGFYYLLLWPVVHLAGSGEFATRLPSAIAMAAAALGTVVIGRRLRSRRTGLYAGLVFAALPLVGVQGHDARPYAFETAAAVLATCLLLLAAARPAAPRLAGYGLSLVVLGYMHLFGLLIIPAHAIALIPVARLERARRLRQDVGGGGPWTGAEAVRSPGLLLRWVVTVVLTCPAMAPLVSLGWHQRGAISWLPKPGAHDVAALIGSFAAGTVSSAVIFGAIALVGLVRADWPDEILRSPAGQAGDAADRAEGAAGTAPVNAWAGRAEWALTAAALPWMVLPPAILLIAAQFKPVYELRYLEYCLPAVALLVGAGIASVGWPLRFAVSGHGRGSRPAAAVRHQAAVVQRLHQEHRRSPGAVQESRGRDLLP
jgi:mannosyltransferase